jgi:hypothetical protein
MPRRHQARTRQGEKAMPEKATKVLKLPTLKLRCCGVKLKNENEDFWFEVELDRVHDDSIIEMSDELLEVLKPRVEQLVDEGIERRDDALAEAKMERAHRHD